VPGYGLQPVFASLGRMLLAAVLMAEVVWLVTRVVGGTSGVGAAVRVVVGGVVGVAAYLGVLALLRSPELEAARRQFSRIGRRLPA
jgi:putative peptidoglycan lipid II flippase